MKNKREIRLIKSTDAASVLAIYEPYIRDTSITFEYDVPSLGEFSERIQTISVEYPWLVCVENDIILGYAYGCKHRYRTAYQWSVESAIYVSENTHRKGIARHLYETLFEILRLQGFVNVYAGVTIPNEKSEGFHLAMGFEKLGTFKKIGYKFEEWHDVAWFDLHLTSHILHPPIPKTMLELAGNKEIQAIFVKANEKIREYAT